MNYLINSFNLWAQQIIVSIIIVAIIEIILPEGNNKKYVKVILGIYIMFSIIYPIVNGISNKKIDLHSMINSNNLQIENMENYETDKATIETNSYIESTYKENLKKEITNKINKEGYEVIDIKIYIETQNQDMYGRINSIVLDVCKNNEVNENENNDIQNENTINKVEEVKINISYNQKNNEGSILNDNELNNSNKNELNSNEINDLKELLYNSYSIEKERIHINE